MSDDAFREKIIALEDQADTACASMTAAMRMLIYRQLNRKYGVTMADIDFKIIQAVKKECGG